MASRRLPLLLVDVLVDRRVLGVHVVGVALAVLLLALELSRELLGLLLDVLLSGTAALLLLLGRLSEGPFAADVGVALVVAGRAAVLEAFVDRSGALSLLAVLLALLGPSPLLTARLLAPLLGLTAPLLAAPLAPSLLGGTLLHPVALRRTLGLLAPPGLLVLLALVVARLTQVALLAAQVRAVALVLL